MRKEIKIYVKPIIKNENHFYAFTADTMKTRYNYKWVIERITNTKILNAGEIGAVLYGIVESIIFFKNCGYNKFTVYVDNKEIPKWAAAMNNENYIISEFQKWLYNRRTKDNLWIKILPNPKVQRRR